MNTCTFSGQIEAAPGVPAAGYLTFALTAELRDTSTGGVVDSPVPIRVNLDSTGSFSVVLAQAGAYQPPGVTYTVTEHVTGAPVSVWQLAIPAGTTLLNLADVAPALPSTPGYAYATPTLGLFAARPASPSPAGQTYFATDDAGGTLYIPNGSGGWTTPGPRGLLASATAISNFALTTVNQAVPGLTVTVTVAQRPVKVGFSGMLALNSVPAGDNGIVMIYEDGAQAAWTLRISQVASSGSNWSGDATFSCVRQPSAGDHTYSIQAYVGGGSGEIPGSAISPALLTVEEV